MIFTGNGDRGRSNIINQKGIYKDDIVFDVLGTIDELSANLALAKAYGDGDLKSEIESIQRELVSVAAYFAGGDLFAFAAATKMTEKKISQCGDDELAEFSIGDGNVCAAHIDIARAVCRRLERAVVRYTKNRDSAYETVAYFNRLSDYLFALARREEKKI